MYAIDHAGFQGHEVHRLGLTEIGVSEFRIFRAFGQGLVSLLVKLPRTAEFLKMQAPVSQVRHSLGIVQGSLGAVLLHQIEICAEGVASLNVMLTHGIVDQARRGLVGHVTGHDNPGLDPLFLMNGKAHRLEMGLRQATIRERRVRVADPIRGLTDMHHFVREVDHPQEIRVPGFLNVQRACRVVPPVKALVDRQQFRARLTVVIGIDEPDAFQDLVGLLFVAQDSLDIGDQVKQIGLVGAVGTGVDAHDHDTTMIGVLGIFVFALLEKFLAEAEIKVGKLG